MSSVSSDKIYLDNLAVGLEFHSGEQPVEADQIIAFASQFDPQPFHLDAEAAKGTFFQGLVASGWHTMAITMKLIVESVPFADGIIGAGGEISWPRPTRPGDTLYVRSSVLEITPSRSKPDRAIVTVECLTFGQDDEVRQKFTTKLVAFRKKD
ncbi:MaoC family dehydratase [Paracoccus sp. NGMCC 1.201697]|uniref:MaoC family dehydratase n=1 Tax=Paracoccus broussonetiae subsp. drimophilus TaxID=3373869 RepID=A0ABW7LJ78_9RHOB